MYSEDNLLGEEEVSFLNFTQVQDELKVKVKILKTLITSGKQKEIKKVLKEIENILE